MKLASIFTDHAVLQRDMPLSVWGTTTPKLRVRVTLGDNIAEGMAGADGTFLVRLPAMKAGGPHTLQVTTPDPAETATCADILIGEVWLCSGQSNMEWVVANSNPADTQTPCDAVRMITVPRIADAGLRKTTFDAAWQPATDATVGTFSAVALNFGRKLHDELRVPVGLIHSSWGGTRIEAWTSRDTLVRQPDAAETVHAFEHTTYSPAYWTAIDPHDPTTMVTRAALALALSDIKPDPGRAPETAGWESTALDDAGWDTVDLPSTWQSNGHKFNGTFWFRRTIDIPADWAGRDLSLGIGAADKHDVTFFNGHQVGATGTGFDETCWNQPRDYTIPAALVKPGPATIAVRVHSFLFDGGLIGPGHLMRLHPAGDPAAALPLTGSWRCACEANLGLRTPPATQLLGPGAPNSPYILFDNMIWPLIPYALRGAIWYQGESNAGPGARRYGAQLRDLAHDWRRHWAQDDFPFLAVQLANYQPAKDYDDYATWPFVREGILDWARQPGGGLAVAIDIGDAIDIHPRNKRDVGHRLAQWALVKTYNKPGPPSGPLYTRHVLEPAGRIRLFFDHIGSGLRADGELKTFFIADATRKFEPAQAVIDGDTVVVWREGLQNPCAVRYAWSDNPEGCNLYNQENLPASPFRTDSW